MNIRETKCRDIIVTNTIIPLSFQQEHNKPPTVKSVFIPATILKRYTD